MRSIRISFAQMSWEFGTVQDTDDERDCVLSLLQRIQTHCRSLKTDVTGWEQKPGTEDLVTQLFE
jgi:hypothetical protein